MKKNIIISFCLVLALMSSCKQVTKSVMKLADATVGSQMDSESTYKQVADLLAEVDPEWKVYSLSVTSEGTEDECKNTMRYVSVGMMNADGDVFKQVIAPSPKGEPSIDNFAPEGIGYKELPAIDFSAEKAMKLLNECKANIPEGYKFLNLRQYETEYDVKKKGYTTTLTINVQEEGKESVNVNGKQSAIYYKLYFDVTPDGKIKVREG